MQFSFIESFAKILIVQKPILNSDYFPGAIDHTRTEEVRGGGVRTWIILFSGRGSKAFFRQLCYLILNIFLNFQEGGTDPPLDPRMHPLNKTTQTSRRTCTNV